MKIKSVKNLMCEERNKSEMMDEDVDVEDMDEGIRNEEEEEEDEEVNRDAPYEEDPELEEEDDKEDEKEDEKEDMVGVRRLDIEGKDEEEEEGEPLSATGSSALALSASASARSTSSNSGSSSVSSFLSSSSHASSSSTSSTGAKKTARRKNNKWTNDFDSAAAFREYMQRLSPPVVSKSEADTSERLFSTEPVVKDMLKRRGFSLCRTVSVDAVRLVVSIDNVPLVEPDAAPARTEESPELEQEEKTPETKFEDFFTPNSMKKNSVKLMAARRVATSLVLGDLEDLCLVIYIGGKICVQAARDLSSLMTVNEPIQTLIVVTDNGATPIASKHMRQYCRGFYQVFKCRELVLPLVDHKMNPKHRIFDDMEKKVFLKRRMVPDENKLPIILESDPYAKFYGMRPGQLVEFRSELGGSLGQCVSYRLVGVAN